MSPGNPGLSYFVMGANTWKSATSHLLCPQTKWTTFYLSGPGGMNRGVNWYPPRAAPSRRIPTHTTPNSQRRAWVGTPAAARSPARKDRTDQVPVEQQWTS